MLGFEFFHDLLVSCRNVNYETYKNYTELDMLLEQINSEAIWNYYEIDFAAFSYYLVTVEDKQCYDGDVISCVVEDDRLEQISNRIISREVRIKFLRFLQKNFESIWQSWGNIKYIETECSRLISKNVHDSIFDEHHGAFVSMPRPDYTQLLSDPEFLIQKTPARRWIEQQLEERRGDVVDELLPDYATNVSQNSIPSSTECTNCDSERKRLEDKIVNLENQITEKLSQIDKLNAYIEELKSNVATFIDSGNLSAEILFQKADEIEDSHQLLMVKNFLHTIDSLDHNRINALKGNKPKMNLTINQLVLGSAEQKISNT